MGGEKGPSQQMKSGHAEPCRVNVEEVLHFCVVDDQLFGSDAVKMLYEGKIWMGFLQC